jgi:hypothetical protein
MVTIPSNASRPAGVGQRTWRDIAKAGMFAVGVAWDKYFKMRHFDPGAASRYGYKPRTAAHKRRKAKRGLPVWLDLVFSGDTRRDVARLQIPRAFPTRVTITMPTARYVQMRPYKRDAPALGDELTRVAADEADALAQVFVDVTEPAVAEHLERATVGGR